MLSNREIKVTTVPLAVEEENKGKEEKSNGGEIAPGYFTLALFVGGKAHHGAAAPRAARDRGADGGQARGAAPSASSGPSSSDAPRLQVTASIGRPSATPAAATPGGQQPGIESSRSALKSGLL